MLVFSTCWNSHRHQDGEEMIDEILSLGFDHVELSHGIKLSLLPGIMRAVEAGKVQVAGVHNYFPAPIDEVGGRSGQQAVYRRFAAGARQGD